MFTTQKEVQERGLNLEDYIPRAQEERKADEPLHKDNPFGICLVDDGDLEDKHQTPGTGPEAMKNRPPVCAASVDDLAAKLKSLQA